MFYFYRICYKMAMCTIVSSLISDQFPMDTENIEHIKKNVKEKYHKTTFTEYDLRPFVSGNYKSWMMHSTNEYVRKLFPFQELQWSFGINPEVPVINLTTNDRTLIAYACSHVIVIYNYISREMSLLGHVSIFFLHA